jgi:hypothetical protein
LGYPRSDFVPWHFSDMVRCLARESGIRVKPDIVAVFPHRSRASFRRPKVFITRRVEHALDVAVQHEHKKTGPPRDARRKTRLWFVSHRRQR